jgi:hypothetical protein
VRLALLERWGDAWAPTALQRADSLWHGDLEDFAHQAARLRRLLVAEGLDHDGVRVVSGLSILRAQAVLARVHNVSRVQLRSTSLLHAELAGLRKVPFGSDWLSPECGRYWIAS